ncbi:MarR family winged helix-turn-helix transcriptional regulator [Microbacteriaceae bacterium 4G12]
MTDAVEAAGPATPEDESAEALAAVEAQMSVLGQRIRAVTREAALKIDPALPPFGLKVLRLLSRNGPTHASAVADQLDVDRSVISRQAKQLEELGLIEFRTDENDGRARFLALTPRATERMAEVGWGDRTPLFQTLASWSTEDLRRFARYIERLNEPLES